MLTNYSVSLSSSVIKLALTAANTYFFVLVALLHTSIASADTPQVQPLWGTPKISELISQEKLEPRPTAIGEVISVALNKSVVSLEKSDEPLTGNVLLDLDVPYDQASQSKKTSAGLDLRYQFTGSENARASLIVLLDGKQISQATTLDFSPSDTPHIKRISRIKLSNKGNLRVTVLCLVRRQSRNDNALCSLNSINLYDMKLQKTIN